MSFARRLAAFVLLLGSAPGCTNETSNEEAKLGTREQLITGGMEVSDTASTVLVEVDHDTATFICSGTLLLPDLVLTAAHCVTGFTGSIDCANTRLPNALEPDAFRATAGADLSGAPDSDFPFVGVRAVHLAAKPGALLCGNDLALLELEEALDRVVPVAAELSASRTAGELVTAVGYGAQHPSGTGERVRRARDLSIVCSGNTCEDVDGSGVAGGSGLTAPPVLSNEFLATDGPCSGDSGGPALREGRVVGVLSRGLEGCRAPVFVGIDERVALLVREHAEATAQVSPIGRCKTQPAATTTDRMEAEATRQRQATGAQGRPRTMRTMTKRPEDARSRQRRSPVRVAVGSWLAPYSSPAFFSARAGQRKGARYVGPERLRVRSPAAACSCLRARTR